ncbi:hypothetical protein D3C73_1016750 [compost metagenome]
MRESPIKMVLSFKLSEVSLVTASNVVAGNGIVPFDDWPTSLKVNVALFKG